MIDSNSQCIFYTNFSKYDETSNTQVWNKIKGVENISLNHSISYSDPFLLGGIIAPSTINAPIQTSLTIDKYVYDEEQFTLNSNINPSCFYIYNGQQYHILTNAYLTDFSVSFSIGDIPKMSTKFSSFEYILDSNKSFPKKSYFPYGMIKRHTLEKHEQQDYWQVINDPESSKYQHGKENYSLNASDDIFFPQLDSIFISGRNMLEIQNNHCIYGIDYSVSYNLQSLFSVGDAFPMVIPLPPNKVSLSITSKIDNENIHKFENLFQDNLEFTVVVSGVSTSCNFYPISGAKLISQEMQISSCNILDFKRNYIGYIIDPVL